MTLRDTLRVVLSVLILVGWGSAPAHGSVPAGVRTQGLEAGQQSPGTRQVQAIEVQGNLRYTRDQLLAALGQAVGAPLDRQRIAAGIQNLWSEYAVRSRVLERNAPDGQGGLELLLIVTEERVDARPRFVGDVQVKGSRLREWAGLDDRSEIYLFEAQSVAARIEEGYRLEGYAHAEVRAIIREGAAGAPPDVIFEVHEGPRVRVKGIEIRGNESLPTRGILVWKSGLSSYAKPKLRGPSLFNWFGKVYTREVLDADILAMRQVYRERGFVDASVVVEDLEYNRKKDRVTIKVLIDEGQRYQVDRVSVLGFERLPDPANPGRFLEQPAELLFPEEELLELCTLKAGEPFETLRIGLDVDVLRGKYGAEGYLSDAGLGEDGRWQFLEPQVVYDSESQSVDVTYRLLQGRRWTVGEVRFEGNLGTLDRVLRREVHVFPGEQADLGEILRGLRRITGTGYFSDELNRASHTEPTVRLVRGKNEGEVDVVYEVVEGRVVDFNINGSVGSDSGVLGRISLVMRNFDISDPPSSFFGAFGEIFSKEAFHGAGQTLGIEIAPGSQTNFGRIRFYEPDLFRTHFDRWSLDLEAREQLRAYPDYDEERTRLRVRIGRQLTPDWTLYFGGGWQQVTVDDLPDPPIPTPLFQQEGRSNLSFVTADLTYSDLDSYVDPREGLVFEWSNTAHLKAIGSDYEFVKSNLEIDVFRPFGGDADSVRPGLRLTLGLGVAQPLGDSEFVPYSERFFLGGQDMRGFDFRGIGPNVNGVPIGGETYGRFRAEYRHPLYSTSVSGTTSRQEVLRGLLFTDWGVLGPDAFDLSLDDMRGSVGFGFGLTSPLPLILAFGFPILEGRGDDRRTLTFSVSFY